MSFADMIKNASGNLKKTGTLVIPEKKKPDAPAIPGGNNPQNPLQRRVSHMDTLKEQIMMRKLALNPDLKKKGGEKEGEDLAKKSYLMSKFADISDGDEDEEESDNSEID